MTELHQSSNTPYETAAIQRNHSETLPTLSSNVEGNTNRTIAYKVIQDSLCIFLSLSPFASLVGGFNPSEQILSSQVT